METQILGTEKYLWSSVLFTIVFVIWGWRIFNWIWLKPKKKERFLRQQGFKGNSYTLMKVLFGDVKENSIEYAEALQKTINIDDETVPRFMPFVHKTIERYGMHVQEYLFALQQENHYSLQQFESSYVVHGVFSKDNSRVLYFKHYSKKTQFPGS
ncbi:Cytochrome [Forsythia ovata]|uniref:Cytochrome n=1 Tax=Forsythia ovata TaxID=205694 RepID=A0ABD1UBP9_9LAMI